MFDCRFKFSFELWQNRLDQVAATLEEAQGVRPPCCRAKRGWRDGGHGKEGGALVEFRWGQLVGGVWTEWADSEASKSTSQTFHFLRERMAGWPDGLSNWAKVEVLGEAGHPVPGVLEKVPPFSGLGAHLRSTRSPFCWSTACLL